MGFLAFYAFILFRAYNGLEFFGATTFKQKISFLFQQNPVKTLSLSKIASEVVSMNKNDTFFENFDSLKKHIETREGQEVYIYYLSFGYDEFGNLEMNDVFYFLKNNPSQKRNFSIDDGIESIIKADYERIFENRELAEIKKKFPDIKYSMVLNKTLLKLEDEQKENLVFSILMKNVDEILVVFAYQDRNSNSFDKTRSSDLFLNSDYKIIKGKGYFFDKFSKSFN